jgi:HD-GYP domain-containing protein (c-di-GMP phosphodiesterase class II)
MLDGIKTFFSSIFNRQVKDLGPSRDEILAAYDATLESWSRALELRERENTGHGQRVVDLTLNLALALGVDEPQMQHIRRGALLHDIGKLSIPDSILLKPGPLTPDEMKVVRQYPNYSYELLNPIKFLEPALDIPYCHHERWDGNGYPRGLKGEAIPLAARIFAVVDVWDALRSDRPYRPAWEEGKVREYVRSLAGSYFDPKVVDAFLKLLDN